MIRIEYIGDVRGKTPWTRPGGRTIYLGRNAANRFADVTPEEYEWLQERVQVRVLAAPAPPAPPPAPLEPLEQSAVLELPETVAAETATESVAPPAPNRKGKPNG